MGISGKLFISAGLAIAGFLLALFILPQTPAFSGEASETIIFSTAIFIVVFVLAERWIDYEEIIKPINSVLDRYEAIEDRQLRLTQSESVKHFFSRVSDARDSANVKALAGYWIALRRDVKKKQICIYLHKISTSKKEVLFSSFDENEPGVEYFVDGVVLNIGPQAIMYGNVRGRRSVHIYSLFVPAGTSPPYVFGTHFQTTLNGEASIATPVVFIRVSEASVSQRDPNVELEFSDVLQRIRPYAKRHDDASLTAALADIDEICDLKASNIEIQNIVDSLHKTKSSVEISSDMMSKFIG